MDISLFGLVSVYGIKFYLRNRPLKKHFYDIDDIGIDRETKGKQKK